MRRCSRRAGEQGLDVLHLLGGHDREPAEAKRGKRSGPKPKPTPAQRQAFAARMADAERASTAGEVAARFGISRATLYRELAKAKVAKGTVIPTV